MALAKYDRHPKDKAPKSKVSTKAITQVYFRR
jgi:hypothetical protein